MGCSGIGLAGDFGDEGGEAGVIRDEEQVINQLFGTAQENLGYILFSFTLFFFHKVLDWIS